jgi:hypothetical protein
VIVSEAVEVSTATPLTKVVAVIEYVPGHTPLLGTLNGNETVCEVFGGKGNGGVVNISDFVLLQLFGCDGPLNENLTMTICVVAEHEITLPETVTVPPKATVDGDRLIRTPHCTWSLTAEEELPLKFGSPL